MAGIGKAMCVLIATMVVSVALITMLSIAVTDKSDASVYTNESTVNLTTGMTQSITSSGSGFVGAMILIVAILFFGSVIMIFRKK